MLLPRLLAQLAPYPCIGCGAEGRLLCAGCTALLPGVPERCYRCLTLRPYGKTCPSCRHHTPLYSVRPRTVYGGLGKDLIRKLKFAGARDAAEEVAAELTPLLAVAADTVIVPVPTATSRVRQRGYDQSERIAKALARRTGLPYAPALRRLGQHHQVGSAREQRRHQLTEAYRCPRPSLVHDVHVVLVDDVLTTGATLEAAASVLLAAGARRVSALVFAQA